MKNTDYWEYSLKHPEPEDLEEEPYIRDKCIVSDSNYLSQVNYLRDLLTTYCTLSKFIEREPSFAHEELGVSSLVTDEFSENPRYIYQVVLKAIDQLLITVDNIQHTEFVAYFKCFGLSHSDYCRKAEMQRLAILEKILQRYCERRKEQYDQLGYTHVIQQALYDSAVSRTQGASGIQKLRQIIEQVARESKITIQEAKTLLEFIQLECSFYPIKQIAELIRFIRQTESKPISYVAFLDGRYFNKFRDTSHADNVREQRQAIEEALKKYSSNYFVNTAGLRKLLADLLSETVENPDGQTMIPLSNN
jgi:hypothetical protein